MEKTLQLTLTDALANAMAATAVAEGKTVDQVALEAIRRDLARRTLQRLRLEAEGRRRDMSDAEIDEAVERAIHEMRQGGSPNGRA